MSRFVVGITGASGVVYGVRLVTWLLDKGHEVHLVISDPARLVLRDELDWDPTADILEKFGPGLLFLYDNHKMDSAIASGSFIHDGMIIVPCTMSTLSGVAHGTSNNLIERAADVTIKEGRKMILVPRETPLSQIHLRNMLAAAEAGAKIVPAMPAYYHKPKDLNGLVDFMVGKILDTLRVPNDLFDRYSGK